MFLGLISTIVLGIIDFRKIIYIFLIKKGLIDAGGISKVFEIMKHGDRLQLSVFVFI